MIMNKTQNKKELMKLIPPKEYWNDEKWLRGNATELSKQYPNKWVAAINKKVVAFDENLGKVVKKAKKIAGTRHFPIHFIEKGIHVYQNQSQSSI